MMIDKGSQKIEEAKRRRDLSFYRKKRCKGQSVGQAAANAAPGGAGS